MTTEIHSQDYGPYSTDSYAVLTYTKDPAGGTVNKKWGKLSFASAAPAKGSFDYEKIDANKAVKIKIIQDASKLLTIDIDDAATPIPPTPPFPTKLCFGDCDTPKKECPEGTPKCDQNSPSKLVCFVPVK